MSEEHQPSPDNSGSRQSIRVPVVFVFSWIPSPRPQRGTPPPEAQTHIEQTVPRSSSAPLGESSTTHFNIPERLLPLLLESFNELLQRQSFEDEPRGNPPAAKSVIDNLPLHTLIDTMSCAVCQNECPKGESVVQLHCRHQYHQDCLVPWLRQHNTCPQCRYELLTDDVSYNESIAAKNAKIDMFLQSVPSKQVETALAVDEASLSPSQQPQQPVECAFSSVLHMDCSPLDEASHTRLACGHNFHTECLESHHRIQNFDTSSFRCPLCRHTQSRNSAPPFDSSHTIYIPRM